MTISREQMDRIKRHLNGDKSEALGAWILDKNALILALAREKETLAAHERVIQEGNSLRARIRELEAQVKTLTEGNAKMYHQNTDLMAEVDDLREHEGQVKEVLGEALTEVVLTIAFLGRDMGTERMEQTAKDLIASAAKLDPKLRAVIKLFNPKE